MDNEKLRVYKIVSHRFLTLIRIEFKEGSTFPLGKILEIFQRRQLPIRFLCSDVTSEGKMVFNLGVDLLSEETVAGLIDELRDLENRNELSLISQVSMAMIYGPHFGEVPGIAGLMLSSLTGLGITPLAMSASASSFSCLFPSVQFKSAMETLTAVFEPPSDTAIL